MKRIIAAAALAAVLPLAAPAFDASDRAAVRTASDRFAAAFVSKDFEAVIDAMPPKLVAYMAQQVGMAADALGASMAQQMTVFAGDVTVEKLDMKTGRMTTGRTPDGIDYAFIPTRTTVKNASARQSVDSQTLALEDGGQWYFLRLEQAQQYEIVKAVYPGFAAIRLP